MPKELSPQAATEFEQKGRMLLAVIEYDIAHGEHFTHNGSDTKTYLLGIYELTKEAIAKRKTGLVKQWFRDMTEEREYEIALAAFVREKTGLDLNLREGLLKRIQRTIGRGRITTGNQFYDIMNEIDYLCQSSQPDRERIALLNQLVRKYEEKGTAKKK